MTRARSPCARTIDRACAMSQAFKIFTHAVETCVKRNRLTFCCLDIVTSQNWPRRCALLGAAVPVARGFDLPERRR